MQAEPKKAPTPAPSVPSSSAPPSTKPVAPLAPPVAKPAPSPPQEENDPPDAVITPGTICKRLGCNQMYVILIFYLIKLKT